MHPAREISLLVRPARLLALGPSMPPARPTALASFSGHSLSMAMMFALTALTACVPTVRTPLKQALPSVLGADAAAPLCYADSGVVDIGGSALAGTVGDIDGDGRLDLALLISGANGYSVTFAMHDGGTGLKQATGLKLTMIPTAIEATDFNGDGILDLAIAAVPADSGDPAVYVLLGRGRGQFISGAVGTKVGPVGLWIADVTSDGIPDIVALDRKGGEVETLIGDGRGEFKNGPRASLAGTVRPEALTLGDFDADKKIDLAMLYDRGGKAEATVAVARGNGEGDFKLSSRRVVGRTGRALVAADFNRDGLPDLVALAEAASDGAATPIAAVLLGDGTTKFSAISYFGPEQVADATLDDLDRNGVPDLVASSQRRDAVRILPADGRGGFGQVVTVASASAGRIVRTADLDGDGRPELLTFGPEAPGVSVLRPKPCK